MPGEAQGAAGADTLELPKEGTMSQLEQMFDGNADDTDGTAGGTEAGAGQEGKKPAAETAKPAAAAKGQEPADKKPADSKPDDKKEEQKEPEAVIGTVKMTSNKPAAQAAAAGADDKANEKPQDKKTPALTAEQILKEAKLADVLKAHGYDDFAIQFLEHRKNGGDPLRYLEVKGRDWTKIGDLDVIKMKIKAENGFLSGEELQTLTDMELSRYGFDEDATEAQKRMGAVLLKKEAHNYRQAQMAEDAKFQIATVENKQPAQQGPSEQEQFATSLRGLPTTKSLLESKKVVLDGGEPGYQLNVELDEPADLIEMWLEPEAYNRTMMKDGQLDGNKMALMSLVAQNPQFVFKSLIDHGRQLERQANLTTKQNIDQKQTQIPSDDGKMTLSQAFAKGGKEGKMGDLG